MEGSEESQLGMTSHSKETASMEGNSRDAFKTFYLEIFAFNGREGMVEEGAREGMW